MTFAVLTRHTHEHEIGSSGSQQLIEGREIRIHDLRDDVGLLWVLCHDNVDVVDAEPDEEYAVC